MRSARKIFESSGLLVSRADVRIFFCDMIASIQSGKELSAESTLDGLPGTGSQGEVTCTHLGKQDLICPGTSIGFDGQNGCLQQP
jgi:hypothetical protein